MAYNRKVMAAFSFQMLTLTQDPKTEIFKLLFKATLRNVDQRDAFLPAVTVLIKCILVVRVVELVS